MKKFFCIIIVFISALCISACSDPLPSYQVELNQDSMETFYKNVNAGKKDGVRLIHYTVEGDPIITDLTYDGKSFTYVLDLTKDKYAGTGSGKTTEHFSKIGRIDNGQNIVYYVGYTSTYPFIRTLLTTRSNFFELKKKGEIKSAIISNGNKETSLKLSGEDLETLLSAYVVHGITFERPNDIPSKDNTICFYDNDGNLALEISISTEKIYFSPDPYVFISDFSFYVSKKFYVVLDDITKKNNFYFKKSPEPIEKNRSK